MPELIIGKHYGIEQDDYCHIGILSRIEKSIIDSKFDLVYLDKCQGYIIGFASELIKIKGE